MCLGIYTLHTHFKKEIERKRERNIQTAQEARESSSPSPFLFPSPFLTQCLVDQAFISPPPPPLFLCPKAKSVCVYYVVFASIAQHGCLHLTTGQLFSQYLLQLVGKQISLQLLQAAYIYMHTHTHIYTHTYKQTYTKNHMFCCQNLSLIYIYVYTNTLIVCHHMVK